MDRPFIFKALLTPIILALPILIWAKEPPLNNNDLFSIDSVWIQQQDKKTDKGKEKPDNQVKPNPKQTPNEPDIREVPKARKQSRPPIVVKPKIKVKSIKVIRPKIKKP